jgi:hypothetical protein
MAARQTSQPRPRSTVRRKPAAEPEPETLAAAATRIASEAPMLTGLKADLIDTAIAAGAYRRTLIREGIPQELADRFVSDWHDSYMGVTSTEHDEIAEDGREPV